MTKRIDDAIYKGSNSAIEISKPDDWGWYRNIEDEFLIIRVRKTGILRKWEPEKIVGTKRIGDIKIDGVQLKNGRPYRIVVKIEINDLWETVTFDQECRISISYYENLKNSKGVNENTSEDVKEEISQGKKEETYVEMSKVKLIPESGYFPSYLFFMLGSTASGKSCWIYALNTQDVRNRAIRQYRCQNNDRVLLYCRNNPTKSGKLPATGITEIEFNEFTVKKNLDDPNKKLVFIVDLGGEVANNKAQDTNANDRGNIVGRIIGLATGIFVVRNEEWLYGNMNAKANETDPARLIYEDLMAGPLLKQQFCYILTGADRIKKAITEDTKLGERLVLASNSVIFSQADNQDQMQENMLRTSAIMKKRDERIGDSPCFAVSNCGDTEDGKLDVEKSYNVELPFIFMLKKFGI